jgi:hypothetical protein
MEEIQPYDFEMLKLDAQRHFEKGEVQEALELFQLGLQMLPVYAKQWQNKLPVRP